MTRRRTDPRPEVPASGNRASLQQLEELHAMVCESLIAQMKAAAATGTHPSAALLGVASTFLKANGVDVPLANASLVDELAAVLPDFNSMDGIPHE